MPQVSMRVETKACENPEGADVDDSVMHMMRDINSG